MTQTKPANAGWPALDGYNFDLFPEQAAAIRDPSRLVHAFAGIRTGKTYGAGDKFFRRIRQDRKKFKGREPLLYWCVAPNYQEGIAQKIEAQRLVNSWQVDWKRQGGDERWLDTKRGGGTLCLVGNITIEFKSGEKPESLVARKVRGVWVTEAARVKWAALHNIRGRISNYPDGWILYEGSPMGHCAYYVELLEPAMRKPAPGVSVHHWTAMQSPFVPREEIEHARATMPAAFFKRDYEASWDTFKGMIWPDWNEGTHFQPRPSWQPTHAVIAADLNTTAEHPACFGWALCNGRGLDNQAWVEGEFCENIGLDYDRYANELAKVYTGLRQRGLPVRLMIDPSAHNQFKAKLRERGVDPWNAENEVIPGIRNVGTVLHPRIQGPRLTVNPVCRELSKAIKGYAWVVDSDGIVRERPDKTGNDGPCDWLRYLCMEAFPPWSTAYKQVR